MTSKKKLRKLLGGALFLTLLLSVSVPAAAGQGSSLQSAVTEHTQQEETEADVDAASVEGEEQTDEPSDRAKLQGWVHADDGKWYYYEQDGSRRGEGWLYYDGCWYWLKQDGSMASREWITYDKNQYYFESWGGTRINKDFTVDGKQYHAGADGSLATGVYEKNGVKYYYDANGALVTTPGWLLEGSSYYYLNSDGTLKTGWLNHKGCWYWLKDDGVMASNEWITYDKNQYYFRSWGGMYSNTVQKIGDQWYGFQSWGGTYKNKLFRMDGKTYYADEKGVLINGWVQDNGKTYYLRDDFTLAPEGWLQLDDSWYWINKDGSRREDEMFTYDKRLYYVAKDGVMHNKGWLLYQGKYYFPESWGGMCKSRFITWDGVQYYLGADCVMVTGWQKIGGYTYYFRSWGGMVTGTYIIDGEEYHFEDNGHLIRTSNGGNGPEAQIGVKTIRNFLKNALLPVGHTLYIWGGGHDDGDALRNGVNPNWKKFFDSQDSSYNYSQHRYEYGNGLDCSGYVGWVSHQLMQTWCAQQSTGLPQYFYNKGWGSYKANDTSMKFLPGDIVSMSGHVWIVVGQCSDGSIVIMHATPPYVQISGSVSRSGSTSSEAIALAKKYMSTYYPEAYGRYGVKIASKDYMTGINHFSWGPSVLGDDEGYRQMKPDEILADLFDE